MIFNEGGMRRRSSNDEQHDLPIYQADGIYGRQRRSNNINGENNNTIYIQPSDVYSEEGSSYDGSDYDDNNRRQTREPFQERGALTKAGKYHLFILLLYFTGNLTNT